MNLHLVEWNRGRYDYQLEGVEHFPWHRTWLHMPPRVKNSILMIALDCLSRVNEIWNILAFTNFQINSNNIRL